MYTYLFFENGLIDDVIVIGWTDSDLKISRALVKMYNILDGTFINPCPAEHGYLPLQNSVDPYQLASSEAS